MALDWLAPEVLVACAQRGIPPSQVKAFEVTDVDVFVTGPTGTIRVEISSLPAAMLEVARASVKARVSKPAPDRAERVSAPRSKAKAKPRSGGARSKAKVS